MWRDMRVSVCLSACFCGLNPRTVPQLSLNKFRAPLGYCSLVLELSVRVLFRSLGTSNGTRAEQIDRAEVAIIKSQKIAGLCWPILGDLFLCLQFFCFVFSSFSPAIFSPPPPPPPASIVQCRVVLYNCA